MRVEELGEHSLDLDAWRIAMERDSRRRAAVHEVEHLALELRVCGGGFEIREQLGHRRWARVDPQYHYKRLQSEAVV